MNQKNQDNIEDGPVICYVCKTILSKWKGKTLGQVQETFKELLGTDVLIERFLCIKCADEGHELIRKKEGQTSDDQK